MKRTLFCMLGLLMLALVGHAGSTKPTRQRVYMFGFAASFTDSVAYMTDLQGVDAYVMPNGFLADRSLYSLQLNNHLVAKKQRENMTCVLFFNKNKAKLEKKYQKVRRKYRENHAVVLQPLGVDEFRFEPEEYIEPVVTTGTTVADSTATKAPEPAKGKTKTPKKKK